jgi:filamentous hemagglutinin
MSTPSVIARPPPRSTADPPLERAAPARREAVLEARDPWDRPMVATPTRFAAWVPPGVRAALEAGLTNGFHRLPGDDRGEVWVWVERRAGRLEVQVYQPFPESEGFFRGRGVEGDAARRLADAGRTHNRDLLHLVQDRGRSIEDARRELAGIHDTVLRLTIEAAAMMVGAGVSASALARSRGASLMVRGARERSPAVPAHAGERGGAWPAIDPRPDAAVVPQRDLLSCGAACGAMLLGDRGLRVAQEEVAAGAGGVPIHPGALERALNRLEGGSHWAGGLVRLRDGPQEEVVRRLCEQGSWCAVLWEPRARLGHAVVVDGVDAAGKVSIRDPWGAGSRYQMSRRDFMQHWTGLAVHRRSR